jgi:hypothetical protein
MDAEASDRVSAAQFRRRAARVRRLAGEATTPAVRQHLRDLAAQFERLADGLDEIASG